MHLNGAKELEGEVLEPYFLAGETYTINVTTAFES
jgi:hypothetical protein